MLVKESQKNCVDIHLFIQKVFIGDLLLPGVLGFRDTLVNKIDNLTLDIYPEHTVEDISVIIV